MNKETKIDSKIINFIILGLFRDNKFHSLNDKSGKEFYIDILDELLAEDIELDLLFKSRTKTELKNPEYFSSKIAEITTPLLKKVKEALKALEEYKWLKIKKINLEVFEKGWEDKALYEDKIIPEGKLLTPIIKITAKEINWSEFIKYIAANNDKNMLDWDNMYAPQKQKHLLIYYINQKRILLEKDKNIILSPNYDNWKELDIRRIQFLNALQELEKDGLIIINGFSLCNPSNLYYYPSIKANITISKKFGEFIKTIESKTEKEYTATSQNQPSIAKKLDKPMQTQNQEKVLYLNNVGELYREPKTKYCYPMNEKSNRYKVIRFLTDNKGYQITKVIAGESGYKSEQTTRTEIGKIRNNIKKYLKIDGKDLLQGKKESGYRINPKYKIVFKDE